MAFAINRGESRERGLSLAAPVLSWRAKCLKAGELAVRRPWLSIRQRRPPFID